MKRYFLIAKDVGDLTAIVCAALEARARAKPATGLDRFVGRFRKSGKSNEKLGDLIVEHDRLTIDDDAIFANDPVRISSDSITQPIV